MNKKVYEEMEEIKKFLVYTKKIGFFFGAGTSCSFGLPDIRTLTEIIEKKIDDSIKETFIKVKDELKTTYDDVSVEDLLNYIRQIKDITGGRKDKKHYDVSGEEAITLDRAICECIFSIIKDCEEKADLSDMRNFMSWINQTYRHYPNEIFTTNYDLIIEKSLEYSSIPYFDGFVGSYEPFFWPDGIEKRVTSNDISATWFRIWKLHGSLNWEATNKGVSSKIIRVSRVEKPTNELVIYPSREKYSLSRKQPFISYFDKLKSFLSEGELLFLVSGFSFKDQHINDLLLNALRTNPRLYMLVFCYTDEQVREMKDIGENNINLGVIGPKLAIINGVICDWENDIPEKEKESAAIYWDFSKGELKTGDFRSLVRFIMGSSGRKIQLDTEANNGN